MRPFSSLSNLVKLALLMTPSLVFASPFHPPAKKTTYELSQQQRSDLWQENRPLTPAAQDLYTALSAEFFYLYGNNQDSLKSYWGLCLLYTSPSPRDRG